MRKSLVTLVAVAVLIAGGATGVANPGTGKRAPISVLPFVPPPVMAFALQRFDACEPLLDYVKQHALEVVGPYGLPGTGGGGWFFAEDAVAFDTAAPGQAGVSRVDNRTAGVDYSTTNVQEVGVDEPDVVKTDGTRILAIAQNRLHYIDVSGAQPRLMDSLSLENGSAHELLLSGDTLLVLSRNDYLGGPAPWPTPAVRDLAVPYYGSGSSRLQQIDISDPADMRIVRTLYVDGSYLSARMVGDTARVVVEAYPTGLDFVYPEGPGLRAEREAERKNRQVIEESTIENWLPYYVMEEMRGNRTITSEGLLVDCSQAFRPSEFSGFGTLSVLTIHLSDGLEPAGSVSVFADGDTVYASQDSLYVATQRWYDWNALAGEDHAQQTIDGVTTQIHKFDISGEAAAVYRATGAVTGFLLNQWAMSEHDGKLRVATTAEPSWWGGGQPGESESFVSVLAEDDGALELIGRVDGLGLGERIYSVRYIDELAYVVTFRQTDPLYIIDLSDPTNPKKVGELKILGYSAYLHPIGDGLLLGIGQDADDQGRTKGTQVAVFDVSDPANPHRLHTLTFGGGSSQVEYDHRAFLYWPATGLTMLPVQTWSSDRGRETWFAGAIGVKAGRDGIEEIGSVTHTAKRCAAEKECSYEWEAQIYRSLVVDDRVYTVSDRGIQANRLSDLADVAWVGFN
ncbi:MAG: beta-propeller domain-containing protein [Chloroflexota bacterium]|nr:beta-propeller domain-containing protein [Chloroflexota bacterium]